WRSMPDGAPRSARTDRADCTTRDSAAGHGLLESPLTRAAGHGPCWSYRCVGDLGDTAVGLAGGAQHRDQRPPPDRSPAPPFLAALASNAASRAASSGS